MDANEEVSFVPMEAVGECGGLDLGSTVSLEDASGGYTQFQDGDIIVAKITPCFENGKGALASGLFNGAALGTTELHVLRPMPDLDARYLFYLTISNAYRQAGESEMYGSGGQKRISTDFIKDFSCPIPAREEQRSIADFLDAKTARIDTLVAKKRELIERLNEKRAALISRTVTRGLPPEAARAAGLDPNPRLKPSGVEWLGDVPEHWEVAQLRRFTTFLTSGSRGWAEHYSETGAMFIRIGNLTRDSVELDLSDIQHVDPPSGAEGERTRIQVDDLLISITAYLGSVAVAGPEVAGGYINQHIALVRLNPSLLLPRFAALAALSDSGQAQLNGQGYGGTKVQLAFEDIQSLWIPVPSLGEQAHIVEYLLTALSKLDRMILKIKEATDRLLEYRTALITAAVTGQIDQRGSSTATSPKSEAT